VLIRRGSYGNSYGGDIEPPLEDMGAFSFRQPGRTVSDITSAVAHHIHSGNFMYVMVRLVAAGNVRSRLELRIIMGRAGSSLTTELCLELTSQKNVAIVGRIGPAPKEGKMGRFRGYVSPDQAKQLRQQAAKARKTAQLARAASFALLGSRLDSQLAETASMNETAASASAILEVQKG
jgi:hypothetical protein